MIKNNPAILNKKNKGAQKDGVTLNFQVKNIVKNKVIFAIILIINKGTSYAINEVSFDQIH